jgi:hypothetical protein
MESPIIGTGIPLRYGKTVFRDEKTQKLVDDRVSSRLISGVQAAIGGTPRVDRKIAE